MMRRRGGLVRGVARTAVVAGTATAVSGRVRRRQDNKWAEQEQAQYEQQAAAAAGAGASARPRPMTWPSCSSWLICTPRASSPTRSSRRRRPRSSGSDRRPVGDGRRPLRRPRRRLPLALRRLLPARRHPYARGPGHDPGAARRRPDPRRGLRHRRRHAFAAPPRIPGHGHRRQPGDGPRMSAAPGRRGRPRARPGLPLGRPARPVRGGVRRRALPRQLAVPCAVARGPTSGVGGLRRRPGPGRDAPPRRAGLGGRPRHREPPGPRPAGGHPGRGAMHPPFDWRVPERFEDPLVLEITCSSTGSRPPPMP